MKRRRPQVVSTLEPAEFGVAFQLAIDAGQNAEAARANASSPIAARDHEPSAEIRDSSYQRAAMALERHFAGESDKFEGAMYRFRAVMELYTKGNLVEWIRHASYHSSSTEIHPAVLDVASRMRLAKNGKFPVRRFLEEVAKTAKNNYADLTEWPLSNER